MKWLLLVLMVMLAGLQYRLWVGDGSVAHWVRLQESIEQQSAENARLRDRNRLLMAEVQALKTDPDAIEERARNDLGMIRPGETFFMVLPRGTESATARR